MNIAVIGGGRVGLSVATGLATMRHSVICCEQNDGKRNIASVGRAHFVDIGLDEALAACVKSGALRFCADVSDAVINADAAFIAVPVSDKGDGLDQLHNVVADIIVAAPPHCFLIIKSTVPPGTCAQLRRKFNICVAANPEFLRQGCGFADFMSPSRIVVGVDDECALQTMRVIYESFIKKRVPYIETNCATAEMAKLAANMFLSSRVALINELADLCEATGGDINDVIKTVAMDKRIGNEYLRAGVGFGGGCLPKDGRLLVASARRLGVQVTAVESLYVSNKNRSKEIAMRIIKTLPKKPVIAVWGFAFKPGADDILESPAVAVVRELCAASAEIKGYDPLVEVATLQKEFPDGRFYDDCKATLADADGLVVLVAAEEFYRTTAGEIRKALKGSLVYDCAGIFNPEKMKEAGLKLRTIGRGICDKVTLDGE